VRATRSLSYHFKPSSQADDVVVGQLAVEREASRIRALLERTADAIDLALDSDWRVAIDILLDLSDDLRAELVP
jgi:hypothetical protein